MIEFESHKQKWNQSGFSRPDQTGKSQNLRPVNRFFTEGFCLLFNASNEYFSKGGAMHEVLKFVIPSEGLRKK